MLAGRDAECADLQMVLEDGLRGSGAVVVVEGEAGIGKTTLAAWAAAEAERLGYDTHSGRADPDGATPPLGPWERALRRTVAGLPESHRADVAAPADPDERSAVLGAWRDAVADAASERPIFVVLEDLHWADAASVHLALSVARAAPAHLLVVVCTVRTGEPPPSRVAPALDRLRTVASVVRLGGLPDDAVVSLVADAGLDADAELVRAMVERTGSNPFFLGELVKVLTATEAGSASAAVRLVRSEVPDRVAEVIERRLARLRSEAVAVLRAAAVLGERGSVITLAAVAELDPEAVMAHLEAAETTGFLDDAGAGRWRFVHALLRDAVYGTIGRRDRHALHLRALAVLSAIDDAGLGAELARHALAALPMGDDEHAIDLAVSAADVAMERLAYEEAADLREQALAVLASRPGGGADLRRSKLLAALGDAQRAAGDMERARASYNDAAGRACGDPDVLAAAALGFADPGADLWIAYRADEPRTAELIRQALVALDEEDSTTRVLLTARLAAELYFSSEPELSRPLSEEAVEMARRLDDPRALVAALAVCHDAHVVGRADPSEALAGSAEITRHARRAGDRRSLLCAHRARIIDLLTAGDLDGVDAEISVFSRVVEDTGIAEYEWWPVIWHGMRALLEGRHDDAEAAAITAAGMQGPAIAALAQTNASFLLFFLRREQGRLDELEPVLRAYHADYADVPAIGPSLALLLAELGHDDEARGLLDRLGADDFARLRDRNWPVSWFSLARAAYLTEERGSAAALLEAGRSLHGSCVMVSLATVCLGAADLGLAWLSETAGDIDAADTYYRQAEATNARLGARSWLAQTRVDLAAMLDRRGLPGDSDESRRLATTALDAAEAVAPVASRARAILGGPGIPPGPVEAVAKFRRRGSTWELGFAEESVVVAGSKGLADLAVLLARPREPVHVLELLAASASAEVEADAGSGSDALLDRRARDEFKRRLADLETEAEEAEAANDFARESRARAERDRIVEELARAVGLGGRARRLDDRAERARKTVTARIRNAIRRLDGPMPALANHLDRSVDTGLWCVYVPEHPTVWEL